MAATSSRVSVIWHIPTPSSLDRREIDDSSMRTRLWTLQLAGKWVVVALGYPPRRPRASRSSTTSVCPQSSESVIRSSTAPPDRIGSRARIGRWSQRQWTTEQPSSRARSESHRPATPMIEVHLLEAPSCNHFEFSRMQPRGRHGYHARWLAEAPREGPRPDTDQQTSAWSPVEWVTRADWLQTIEDIHRWSEISWTKARARTECQSRYSTRLEYRLL